MESSYDVAPITRITAPEAVPDEGYTYRIEADCKFSDRLKLCDTVVVVDENGNEVDMNSSIPSDQNYYSRIFTI